ncbi:hypothetical protein Pmani_014655 [Petrolisthes manimaculis]|uniref:Lysosomal dipeptide transporter MFSD1 n=1 Tax=Petrolisthes manimaculis TaxID=1843537 RepID=A0AAE1PTX0_9EUCA|nr:hypothetical protein Pmani_014655 [Petrolisthes manimaculis]
MVDTGSTHSSGMDEDIHSTPSIDIVNGVTEEEEGNEAEEEVILTGCGATACCNPRKGPYRFIGLIFMCFLGFGSYFCYDTPGSLQDYIIEDMEVDTVQYVSLYSLYSWPNVILSFVGGFLIDRVFGIRWGTIIFSTLVTAGQFVYAMGALVNKFWLMQLGRFIFGMGGESLAVAQNTYTVSWFKGKELNTVFGLLLSVARVGSGVNFLGMGPLYEWVNTFSDGYKTLGIALLIAGVTCIFSLCCAIILGLLDKRRSRVLHMKAAQSGEKVKLTDVLSFPLSFWLISVICVTYYVTIFPFIGLAKVFFMRKFDMSSSSANTVSSIVYFISTFASPIMGNLVDRTGRNVMWVFCAVLLTLFCHGLLTFTFVNPYVPMSLMGVAYSLLASSLWPMVSLIIPEHQLGSAYGMMQSVQNLGLALISMLGGLIVETKGYLMLEMFYLVWLCVALVSTVVIWLSESAREGVLNLSISERRRKDEETECLIDPQA